MTSSKSLNDKKHTKKSGEAASRSKDKERKSKHKERTRSSERDKTDAAAALDDAIASSTASIPVVHDPDAIQLFRRYDQNRSGMLTRFDFLQLLKDYADPSSVKGISSVPRPPLSLTDSSGIPLGYQRADRNSEFEAGQLFERYDKDQKGALTLDKFHLFFADFKAQLQAFVEENNYRPFAPPETTIASRSLEPVQEEECLPASENVIDTANVKDTQPSLKAIKVEYRAALRSLRKLCKDELYDQRERLVQRMQTVREEKKRQQQRSSSRWTKRRPRTIPFTDFAEKEIDTGSRQEIAETKQYEAMEDDLDRLDDLIGYVRRHLNKGSDISQGEMQQFLDQADKIEDEAECLAMKDYETFLKTESKENNPPWCASPLAPPPPAVPPVSAPLPNRGDLESLLRVKDQMIYQLLQERTAMRKERFAIETSLKNISEVSTREMKKWARLTDDMQIEIQQLQSQLRSQSAR